MCDVSGGLGLVSPSRQGEFLAKNNHCDIFVPLDEVQLMNMKPKGKQKDQQ